MQAVLLEALEVHPNVDPDRLRSALHDITEGSAALLKDELKRRMPEMLADHRRIHAGFHGRLRRTWGRALNAHFAVVTASCELGEALVVASAAGDEKDREVADVLGDLHAQACRVAFEVNALLDAGLPVGAQARARTIHELAVTTIVISDHAECTDIAARYRRHHVIDRARDATEYTRHHAKLGYDPLEPAEAEAIMCARDEAVKRYGKTFTHRYGWAAGVLGNGQTMRFEALEQLAGVSHLRPYYLWACHAVHAGSRGAALNRVEFRGQRMRMAGHTNAGLADPGNQSLLALQQINASFVARRTHVPTLDELVQVSAIGLLVKAASDAFTRSHRRLQQREQRLTRAEVCDLPEPPFSQRSQSRTPP